MAEGESKAFVTAYSGSTFEAVFRARLPDCQKEAKAAIDWTAARRVGVLDGLCPNIAASHQRPSHFALGIDM